LTELSSTTYQQILEELAGGLGEEHHGIVQTRMLNNFNVDEDFANMVAEELVRTMTYLWSFDPGLATGAALGYYDDETPYKIHATWSIPDGLDGFIDWLGSWGPRDMMTWWLSGSSSMARSRESGLPRSRALYLSLPSEEGFQYHVAPALG
jgi:hypothetical protein